MNNDAKKDWREVVDKPSKLKFEMQQSYANSYRSRITRATNFGLLYPGTRRVRVDKKVLIVIDLKSKFNKDAIDDFLSQALDFYKNEMGAFLKVKVSLFDGENLSNFIDLTDYKALEYGKDTNDSNYKTIIDISRRNRIDEVLIFTDGNQNDIELNVKDISIKYCFDTLENYERADNILTYNKGYFVRENN
ncbi:MAG: hypothetical protein IJ593_07825 [Lachnospiraceae bacterium]|nr:hypothetical protein [Lachnospiraceae bacterium]